MSGRLLLGVLLLLAPLMPGWLGESTDPRRETTRCSLLVVLIAAATTAVAFLLPLPEFIFPEGAIPRPVDFLSAIVFLGALAAFGWEYHQRRDMLSWWVMLSLGVNLVGQVMMSFSKSLYDPFFDIAHVYKVLGYALPLLGFSLYQIAVLRERTHALEELRTHRDHLGDMVAERTAELRTRNERLQREIAERKRAEEALRESEERLRLAMEAADVGTWRWDPSTNMDTRDANFNRTLGLEPVASTQPVEGFIECVHAEDRPRVEEMIDKALRERGAYHAEFRIVRPDGKVRWLSDRGEVICSGTDQIQYMTGAVVDITERKRTEERLQSLNAELERSNRDLQDFTYTVSHDLQEPLRKIHTFGQFLMEDCGDRLPEEGRQHLRHMQDAALRMKELIQHLLALARVGTCGGELAAVASRQVLNTVVDTLSEKIREVEAEVAVENGLPIVMADEVQLRQVFQNLVGNALKFWSPGRPPRIVISGRAEGEEAVFSVADNGIGIENRFLDKIFGVFQRLHAREQYEGAGVGLALCEKIIRRHGGRIWAESELGKGSTFHFALRSVPMTEEENA